MILEMIVIATLVLTIPVILIINKMKDRFFNKRLSGILYQSSEIATRFNLSFSSQVVLHDMVLGVDGVNRKIMIIKEINGNADCKTIDLNLVKECMVHKEYENIEAGGLRKRDLVKYLKSISLNLVMASGNNVILPFYEMKKNNPAELQTCESRARDWESMLNKLRPHKVRA